MTPARLKRELVDRRRPFLFANFEHPLVTTEHLDNGVFWDLYELLDTYYE